MQNLALASLLALTLSASLADARRLPPPPIVPVQLVFEIDHRNKIDSDSPESHFELRADGTWSYVRTVKQSIQKRAGGQLSRVQLRRIRALLGQAPWRVSQADMTCMAFAGSNTQFSVNGRLVWTDEMCSGDILDRRSTRQLAHVMAIVDPLLPR